MAYQPPAQVQAAQEFANAVTAADEFAGVLASMSYANLLILAQTSNAIMDGYAHSEDYTDDLIAQIVFAVFGDEVGVALYCCPE